MRTNTIQTTDLANSTKEKWDEDDLVQRLCRTLDFAERAIRQLGENGYADSVEQQATVRPEKLIAETAILLLAASKVSDYAAIGPRILRVASLLVPHARSPRMLRGICLEPAVAFEYATAHICLKRLGFYDPDFDAMLDLSAASQASDGRERAPHRMLEQEWLKQGWLYPEGLPRLRSGSQVTNSVLNRTMDLLHGTREDVYCFTHALMYLRDFNLFTRPLPRMREALLEEAEGMLARCLDEQDYDLAGEVLLAWPLTGESWSSAAAFAFRVLARVESAAGFLPAPTTRVGYMKSLDPETGRQYFLATAYHTVYVMGLLCAAALSSGRRPPVKIPLTPVRAGAFDAVSKCLEGDDRRAHWQDDADELEPAERESLAGFFLSIGLHREFGRRNFAAMERLLSVGTALGLTANPVASQAAEMMTRVSQFALFEPLLPRLQYDSARKAESSADGARASNVWGEASPQAVGLS
ncbi:DUF6895 family protein [Granulicella arctica]|uniref:DUF6895 domain-containing protein n=1 Tax=Granulicella arctica TaxID=940613 RepID=A0A7Y9TEM4_9BACT|nr:hypothetical protein [Granulicella arctica]NYF77831.1 hypothetical protein [Granulicella arctica]